MKIVTVLGARPQFIKAGSVSREIQKHSGLTEIIVHTGQHYDENMSDVFFEEMRIPRPDYFLGIGGKSHGAMTGQMIEKIEEVLIKEKPDFVMVYGDTNSTLAGALAASKLHIPIAHVEAGLRSFNMKMPEEINRILTDRISSLLFCPTQIAIKNLENEGVQHWGSKVILSGDVMQDGALYYRQFARKPASVTQGKDFILCTIHRAENTDNMQRLSQIVSALNELHHRLAPVVLPLHPRSRKIIQSTHLPLSVQAIDPVGYLEMMWFLNHCSLVMTDSGGLQKEAYFFKKPCLTLRDETEWLELVEIGANTLVGADPRLILEKADHFYGKTVTDECKLYGEGSASKKIVESLLNFVN